MTVALIDESMASSRPPSKITLLRERFRRMFEKKRESSLVLHARTELQASGLFDDDSDYEGSIAECVMELVAVFSKQGHSGFGASVVANAFNKVARYEPLGPLTGEDDEWVDHGAGMFQNKRCGRVFKQPDRFDGQAYDLDGKIFRGPDGCTWTSPNSMVPITFPYTPTHVYVDCDEHDKPLPPKPDLLQAAKDALTLTMLSGGPRLPALFEAVDAADPTWARGK